MNGEVKRGFLLVLGGLIAAGAAYLIYLARGVVLLLFVAIIVGQAITPVIAGLTKRGWSFGAALAAVYVVLIAGCGLLAWRLDQDLGTDLSGTMVALANVQRLLRAAAQHAQPLLRGLFGGLAFELGRLMAASPEASPRQSVSEARVAVQAVFAFVSVLVLSAYWLAEQASIRRLVVATWPARHQPKAAQIWDDVASQFGAWARGEILLVLFIAIPFGLALAITGSPYPVLLALFAGVVGVIPVVGSIVGPAPAVILSLSLGLAQGLFVLSLGIALQLIEGIVIGPRLMSRLTGVSPFVVLVGVIVGAAIDGVTGAFVAVPLAAIAAVGLRHWLPAAAPEALPNRPALAAEQEQLGTDLTPALRPVRP